MPFSTTGSVVSTDLDNMLRGLFRDNSDKAVTGTAAETNMASTSIAANTIGPTGGLFVLAIGSAIGAGGTKAVRLYLGASQLTLVTVPSGNQCWFLKAWIYNTSTGAQRIFVEGGYWGAVVGTPAAPTLVYQYTVMALDTTANQTLKVTTTNANVGDTITQSMWAGYVVQIT